MKGKAKEKLEEIEFWISHYAQKSSISRRSVIAILASFAITTSSAWVLSQCSFDWLNDKLDVFGFGKFIEKENLKKEERLLESDIAKYLSSKLGIDITLVDMKDVRLVKGDENYLLIKGDFSSTSKNGECRIVFKVSKKTMEELEKALERSEAIKGIEKDLEKTVCGKYGEVFLESMREAFKDENTSLEGVYDKDDNKPIFTEMDASKKVRK